MAGWPHHRRSLAAAGLLAAAVLPAAVVQAQIDFRDCLRAQAPGEKLELIVTAAPTQVLQLRKVLEDANLDCVAQLQINGACLVQVPLMPGESPAALANKLRGNILALSNDVASPEMQRVIGNVAVNQNIEIPMETAPTESSATAFSFSCDPFFDKQVELKAIGAEAAWFDAKPSDVIVAVVDTGVQREHEDLKGKVKDGTTMGCGGVDCDGEPRAGSINSGHGTKVAGILGAKRCNHRGIVGVAWNTRIVSFNYGVNINEFRVSCGVQYALAQGASVINLSAKGLEADMPTLNLYLRDAEAKGVLLVTAAGNEGVDLELRKLFPLSSKLPNVLGVMGFNQGATEALSSPDSVSNFGKNTVHIAAPNSAGKTTNFCPKANCYRRTASTGTSWATAYVSGAAALLKSRYPTASYDFLKWRIVENATKDVRLKDMSISEGRLNLARTMFPVTALNGAVSRSVDTPVDWQTGIRDTACAQVSIEGRFVKNHSIGSYFTILGATPNDGIADLNHEAIPASADKQIQLRVKCSTGDETAESMPMPLR